MVVCLLSHWGFLTQLRQMVAVIMEVNASQMTAFFPPEKSEHFNKGVEWTTKDYVLQDFLEERLENAVHHSERRLSSSEGLEPKGEKARAPIQARHLLALGPSLGSIFDLSEPWFPQH